MDRTKLIAVLVSVLTVVVVGVVLKATQAVVLPLIIAWLLSYLLGPVVTFLTSRRAPIGLATTLVLLLLFLAGYLVAVFLHARISGFVAAYPNYEKQLTDITTALANRWKLPYNPLNDVNWGEQVGSFLVKISGSMFVFLSKLVMVVFFLVFLLLGKPYFDYKLKAAVSKERAEHLSHILRSISREIGRYLSVQFLISLFTGILVWLALTIIGVDFPVTWGAFAFFLNFIPNIGSIVASVPPVLLAVVQFYPSPWRGLATLLALLSIQMVLGSVVSPKVMGDRLNLSPLVVLLSLVFWGWLWGITGALLSVPIASAIKIVCANIDALRPISVMMGSGKSYYRKAMAKP